MNTKAHNPLANRSYFCTHSPHWFLCMASYTVFQLLFLSSSTSCQTLSNEIGAKQYAPNQYPPNTITSFQFNKHLNPHSSCHPLSSWLGNWTAAFSTFLFKALWQTHRSAPSDSNQIRPQGSNLITVGVYNLMMHSSGSHSNCVANWQHHFLSNICWPSNPSVR